MSWESLFLFDLTIFCLTLFKTWQERRRNPITIGRNDIVSLVMRDGGSSLLYVCLIFTDMFGAQVLYTSRTHTHGPAALPVN